MRHRPNKQRPKIVKPAADPATPAAKGQEDPLDAELRDLVDGKTKPPNETVAYLLGRLKTCKENGEQLVAQANSLEQRVGQLRMKANQLQGAINSYADDLRAALRGEPALGTAKPAPAAADKPPEPAPSTAAAS